MKVVVLEFSGASLQVKHHQRTAPGGKMHRILGLSNLTPGFGQTPDGGFL